MTEKNSGYRKVSDADLAGSRHNFDVFLGELRTSPLKSIFIGGLFTLLAVFILRYPQSDSIKFFSEWMTLIPAGIAILAALWFLLLGIRGYLRR